MPKLYGIIPAAGSGSRLGSEVPKQFLEIAGRPMVDHGIATLLTDPRIDRVQVICSNDNHPVLPGASLDKSLQQRVSISYISSNTRVETVAYAASMFAAEEGVWLAVHDAARPCLHPADLTAVLDATENFSKPTLLAEPLAATLKQAKANLVTSTIDRSDKWLAQTPQVASASDLHNALKDLPTVTDEAGALEKLGIYPTLVANTHPNPKITTLADFALAEVILRDL